MPNKIIIISIIFFSLNAAAQIRQVDTNTQGQRQDITITGAQRQQMPVARAFAYAPNIISKCSGSAAAGAQGQFVGLSFAGSYKDEFCERAELIKLAISMGHYEVADDLFYQFPMVKDLSAPELKKELCDYPTEECKQNRRYR